MATGTIQNLININTSKTFTMDCTSSPAGLAGWSCGELILSSADVEYARAVIPLYARKAGYNYPLTVAYENGSLRLLSPTALTGVKVGVALIY